MRWTDWTHDIQILLATAREPGGLKAIAGEMISPAPALLCLTLALILGVGLSQGVIPRWQTAIALNEQLHDKQSLGRDERKKLRQLTELNAQMKSVPTRVHALSPGESPAVAAMAMAQETLSVAKNMAKDVSLPADARQCQVMGMAARGHERVEAPPPEPGWPTAQLNRYQYELTLRAPYPTLLAFMNRLMTAPKLVGVDRVDVQRLPLGRRALPDILSRPNYPVPLEMTATLSFYAADPPSSASGADATPR